MKTTIVNAITGEVTEREWTAGEIAAREARLAAMRPVPASITRRQCAVELRERGMITAQEALDMTRSGLPPAMVMAVFSQVTPTDAINAQTDFAADTYMRDNPLLNAIMAAVGASASDIDQFFISASGR